MDGEQARSLENKQETVAAATAVQLGKGGTRNDHYTKSS